MKISIILTCCILIAYGICGATQISGDISGVLSADDNPYEVVGDLRVPQCSTLVIEAGCYIEFQGYYTLSIDTSAVLKAFGEPEDSIIFTTSSVNPAWGSIRFFNSGDTCKLNYCIIENGLASVFPPYDHIKGGGIYACSTSLVISNCSIRGNEAYEGNGGGLYIENSNVEIYESDISNNYSSFSGGGLYCSDSHLSLISCTIAADTSFYVIGGGLGGGIYINRSEAIIMDNTITQNYSHQSGGGICLNLSNVYMINNKVINNVAYDMAGGILISAGSEVVLANSIIAYNTAIYWRGGGVLSSSEDFAFNNNTVYGNNSIGMGGGLLVNASSNNSFSNNIIWNNYIEGNPDHPDAQIYSSDTSIVICYSCVQNGWSGEGNIDIDPRFSEPSHFEFNLRWDNYPLDDETKSACIDAGAPWSPLDPDSTRADMGALYFDQWLNDIDDPEYLPRYVKLSQNYPNPFNNSTLISYELPISSEVTISIYDILGREIAILEDGVKPAGNHQIAWSADDIASGVYFYKIQANGYSDSKKMILMK